MPLIDYLFGYQVYFWSNEVGEPIHFHIAKGKRGSNNTKFWIMQDGSVRLASNHSRYSNKDINKIIEYCRLNTRFVERIVKLWAMKFGSVSFKIK